jgi:SAM-dependent methyltransferase
MPQHMEVTCEDPRGVMPEALLCPTCGIELQPYRDLQSPYHLRRCPACQLVATWPRLSLGELRQQYESEYEQSTFHPFPLYLRRRRQVLARIMRHAPQGTMLDIGCAGGHFLSHAREHGWGVTGIELNRQMAECARRNFQIEVHNLSMDDLPGPLEGRRFEVVYMSHVLEHLPRPDRALRKIRDLLAPDGVLALRVPNLHALLFRLLGKHYIELYPDVHVFHFTRRSLSHLLAREGYAVEEMSTRQCDFASEGFVLMKGILDAAGIYRRVKPRADAPASEARSSRVFARAVFAPLHLVSYPLWAFSSRVGLGYELFAVSRIRNIEGEYSGP